MSLTVAQALRDLPVLSQARVAAGRAGLDRQIRWTHIIDHPEVIPWVKEGHLLLTTAFALMLHPEAQAGLIHSLNEKGLAGMMINIGRYMFELPSSMIEAADLAGFPLITIPWEVDISEITHAIHEWIWQEQYALAEQANHIHQILTQIVLDGGDLTELTRRLAEILGCSVTIEDDALRLLAHATQEPTDEVRRRSIELGRTPDEMIAFLHNQNIVDRLRQDPRPLHLAPCPEIGLTLDRIVSPILVGSRLFGYIWIIASDDPLTELDSLVIERGATVAALILSRQEAIYETEQRIKNQSFESLLNPDQVFPPAGMPEAAWQVGLRDGCIMLAMDAGNLDRQSLRKLTTLVDDQLRAAGIWVTVIERGARLAVVLGTMEVEGLRPILEQLLATTSNSGYQVTVGISSPFKQMSSIRQGYQQAADALTAALALGYGSHRILAYEDLGFLGEFISRSLESRPANRYSDLLQKMETCDREKNTQYLHTLEAYLDHLASVDQAARALFIHRNTLYQRLAKITDLWGIDFHDPLVVLNLNLAIKDWHLNSMR